MLFALLWANDCKDARMTPITIAASAQSGTAVAGTNVSADASAGGDAFMAILQQQLAATTDANPLAAMFAARTDNATTGGDPLAAAMQALTAGQRTPLAARPAIDDDSKATDDAVALTSPDLQAAQQPVALPLTPAVAASPAPTVAASTDGQQNSATDNKTALAARNSAIIAANPGDTEREAPAKGTFEPATNFAAVAAAAMQAAPAHTAVTRTTAPTVTIASPVGSTAWHGDVANSVAWVAGQNQSRADLVLTPPELGRVEVSITVSGDQASASFVSASPAVREALEGAVPRLREVLAESGITLTQAQIGADTSGQSAKQQQNGDNRPWQEAAGQLDIPVADTGRSMHPVTAWQTGGRGMVDVFA
jgi:flagellar hook-length control protein FliK